MSISLETVVIEPQSDHTATVIWLHGLGADGHDFEPIVEELALPSGHGMRFIFPHAPMRPITINQGYVMRGWYDIRSMQINREEDSQGIIESAEAVATLIEGEMEQGLSSDKILLAGFSQGGAIALHLGLRYEQPLAGIMALSTYLPLADKLEQEHSQSRKMFPILLAHGIEDAIVPLELGIRTRSKLTRMGYKIDWFDYEMGHSVCYQEIKDISAWLQNCLIGREK